MGDWIGTTIGQQVTLQRGFDITKSTQRDGPYPVVSSGGTSSYHDVPAAKGPGVILGRKGVVGSVYYVPGDYWPHDTTLWVKDFHKNHPRFVYYFFKQMAPTLASLDVGSANPTLNRNHVHPTDVLWPPISEQRRIAHILGSLDDKIDLNRRMSETLEAMARAIFRSWFVDFDPVRAKMEGRKPVGMDAKTAMMFPNSLVAVPCGLIPGGWKLSSIAEISTRIAMGPFGSDIKTDNFQPTGVPIIRGRNLTNGFVDDGFVFLSPEKAEELSRSAAYPGDIVITHRGTLGQVGLIPSKPRYSRYIASQSQMVLSVNRHISSPAYVYSYLVSPAGQHSLLANTSQTGVPAIAQPTKSLKNITLIVPSEEVDRAFDSMYSVLDQRKVHNSQESQTLVALRDMLLPRLLSGEIRVTDAESLVEAKVP